MTSEWNTSNVEQVWDAFLARWPLEGLGSITLSEYTEAGNPDCFVNWLEARTTNIGSIWGGSSFKFGIYRRDDHEEKDNTGGRHYGVDYAWYEKYGTTPEEAFRKVLTQVESVARAGRIGDLAAIESADLGPAVKWKIAFLYQNRLQPAILPIFKLEMLRAGAGSVSLRSSMKDLNAALMEKRSGRPLFEFAADVWKRGNEVLSRVLTVDAALNYLQERLQPTKEPTKYIAGFLMPSGRELALDRQGRTVSVFVEPGPWTTSTPEIVVKRRYRAQDTRNSNLGANAPNLATGRAADLVSLPTMASLVALCDAYDEGNATGKPVVNGQDSAVVASTTVQGKSMPALNRILFGPPGTGKTYRTAQLAVEICDGKADSRREVLMARYRELCGENRIFFVTFHQSYGYEDFVEGLRPVVQDGQVHYWVRPGIFRKACDAARRSKVIRPGLAGKPLSERTVYKMSLGRAGTALGDELFGECLKKGYILLGYGRDVDFTDCKTPDEIEQTIKGDSGIADKQKSHARYVSLFKLDMQVGDIVIASQGNSAFKAVGEVVGDYEFLEDGALRYRQMRPVRWLAAFEANHPTDEIYDKNFVMSTLYKLDPKHIKWSALNSLVGATPDNAERRFVLIIDEINRANISKVFGELITLLEPDKREGALNALTVRLPYSDESEPFSVPGNLHVVGTMNSADRSIALIDTALRRRFEFVELLPDYSALPGEAVAGIDLRAMLRAMNDRIEYLYDRDHTIGHAYFVGVDSLESIEAVFRHKVIPLLQEYFYEDLAKVALVLNDTNSCFIESASGVPVGLNAEVDDYASKPRFGVRGDAFPLSGYFGIYQ